MTDEQFAKSRELKEQIETLCNELDCFWRKYDKFVISGVHKNGTVDWICNLPDELRNTIKDWYDNKIRKLEAEFEDL